MIVVRAVTQAKFGKADELVQLIKERNAMFPIGRTTHIMTDASGPFFSVVTETEFESFAAYEAAAQEFFNDPRFGAWFERMVPLVESGQREFYTLVE